MARTASSNSTKPRKSKDNGSTHDGETKVQPELDLEPEPLWKKILLAIPRAFGSGVRAVTGVGEYDPAYRRDGLCFLLLVLAVLFCASEWFRVSGPFGQLLHAIAAGVLGLMSVVLPVLLAAVAFRLMRNSGKGSNNPRVVTGWVLLMWSICSIIDVAIAADHTGFDITILQSAGGLFGFFLGSPLAWGLSNVFAIIIFVVVGLFSLLMITGTHVTDLPEDARKIAAKIQRKPYVPMGQETDGSASQFPNEVRVGDTTLAFADGVPSHDGDDDGSDNDQAGDARPSLFARLFGRKSKTEDDKTLDKYAADDPFDRAASQHGATAETPMTGEIIGARTIASSSYDGRPHLSSPAPAADADDGDASRTRVITSGQTVAMPGGGAVDDPWAPSAAQAGTVALAGAAGAMGAAGAAGAAAAAAATGAYAGADADGSGVGQGVPNTGGQPNATAGNDTDDDANRPYQLPDLNLLTKGQPHAMRTPANDRVIRALTSTFEQFNVDAKVVGFLRGPSVTQYEVELGPGVKVEKVTNLQRNIAYAVASSDVRILSPIPGKSAIGIEIPNEDREIVHLGDVLRSDKAVGDPNPMLSGIGKDVEGHFVTADLTKMPHLLVAGATGSGKSVCTNSIIMSILYHATPEEVKLILIDPKIVEFTVYEGIPHLLIPVVTDPKKAAGALNWAVQEMQRRYNLFAENSVRDLGDYNAAAAQPNSPLEPMPQIVVIIDELADLMMTTSKEVEDAICRLAQKARAAGMHLIIATQRPTTDIITGLIKANIPSRIALSVMSQVDSRTILDTGGAEKLLGHGDMLYLPNGKIKPVRVQGCFTSTKEIEKVVDFIKSQTQSEYSNEIMEQVEQNIPVTKAEGKVKEQRKDSGEPEPGSDEDIFERAIEVVVEAGQASTSSLQRRLKLGYARAARIMDELEEKGIIGPYEGAKPRRVLMSKEQFAERKMRRLQ